ncbi:MAG: hypothetical protein AVDCRST_MAG89-3510, partial [uncultured Gemmatimonadetes bacterium]
DPTTSQAGAGNHPEPRGCAARSGTARGARRTAGARRVRWRKRLRDHRARGAGAHPGGYGDARLGLPHGHLRHQPGHLQGGRHQRHRHGEVLRRRHVPAGLQHGPRELLPREVQVQR